MKLVAIDFETANYSPLSACAIGVTVFEEGELILTYSTLIQPVTEVNYFARKNIEIHGITPEDVKDAPTWKEVFPEIQSYLEDSIIVAHNVQFDLGILKQLCYYYQLKIPYFRYFDTIQLARKLFRGLVNYRLNTVSEHLGIQLQHHDANSDARACALIVINSMNLLELFDLEEFVKQTGVTIYQC